MHIITLYATFHFRGRCFVLVSYHITRKQVKKRAFFNIQMHFYNIQILDFLLNPLFKNHTTRLMLPCDAQVT